MWEKGKWLQESRGRGRQARLAGRSFPPSSLALVPGSPATPAALASSNAAHHPPRPPPCALSPASKHLPSPLAPPPPPSFPPSTHHTTVGAHCCITCFPAIRLCVVARAPCAISRLTHMLIWNQHTLRADVSPSPLDPRRTRGTRIARVCCCILTLAGLCEASPIWASLKPDPPAVAPSFLIWRETSK